MIKKKIYKNINNFFLIKNKEKIFIEFKHFLEKEKKIIKFKTDSKRKIDFILGYKLSDNSGEYTIIKIENQKIKIITDLFLSYPIYYYLKKDLIVISTNIIKLHSIKKPNLEINKNSLVDLYNYGFNFKNRDTIFKSINQLDTKTLNIFQNFKFKSEPLKNLKIKKHNGLFKKQIENKIELLNINKPALALTSGIDSNIVLKFLSNLNIEFDCICYGNKNSHDVKFSKIFARKYNKNYIHKLQNYTNRKNISSLLNEYAEISSGIGISSEIFLMELAKKISKKYKFLFLGGGGEFYRNYFINKKRFISNYLTLSSTLKKFLKEDFYKICIIRQNQIKKKKIKLRQFYLKSRYPYNSNRKNNYLKNYIFPINFLVDENLYKNFLEDTSNYKKYFHVNIKRTKQNNVEAFNIDNFFKIIKPFLIKNLNILSNYEIFIDVKKTIYFVKNNLLDKRDKWFLLRILNLILYINIIKNN